MKQIKLSDKIHKFTKPCSRTKAKKKKIKKIKCKGFLLRVLRRPGKFPAWKILLGCSRICSTFFSPIVIHSYVIMKKHTFKDRRERQRKTYCSLRCLLELKDFKEESIETATVLIKHFGFSLEEMLI